MFSSMLLTLLIVPVFYIAFERAREWLRTPEGLRRLLATLRRRARAAAHP